MRGKVYEAPSNAYSDIGNVGATVDGKMYVEFSEDGVEWEGWTIYYKPDNDNNCTLNGVFDSQNYAMEYTINTPLKLRIDGVYGQSWIFTKTSNNKIVIQYGNGPLELFDEGSEFELMNLEEFKKLDCK